MSEQNEHLQSVTPSITPWVTPSVLLNVTHTYTINNISFGNLSQESVIEIFKDGRVFSHFIEKWLTSHYPLIHVSGCRDHDFIDPHNSNIKYDEKTFTRNGCNFCPSNMLGQGRVFNMEVFEEKNKKLIFCIVSNINFPEIKVKFMKGVELLEKYPKGKISLENHIQFFD